MLREDKVDLLEEKGILPYPLPIVFNIYRERELRIQLLEFGVRRF